MSAHRGSASVIATRPSLSAALAAGPLLLDGAMGSLLYERGILHTRSYDELNLSQPDVIKRVHADYVAAGAELVETNTFGSNRIGWTSVEVVFARIGDGAAELAAGGAGRATKSSEMVMRNLSMKTAPYFPSKRTDELNR